MTTVVAKPNLQRISKPYESSIIGDELVSRLEPGLIVRPTSVFHQGNGTYANRSFGVGDFVATYPGIIQDDNLADMLQDDLLANANIDEHENNELTLPEAGRTRPAGERSSQASAYRLSALCRLSASPPRLL